MGIFFGEHIANIHICCMKTKLWFSKLMCTYKFYYELLITKLHLEYCYVLSLGCV